MNRIDIVSRQPSGGVLLFLQSAAVTVVGMVLMSVAIAAPWPLGAVFKSLH